jgi:hypothetical protein
MWDADLESDNEQVLPFLKKIQMAIKVSVAVCEARYVSRHQRFPILLIIFKVL